MYPCKTASLRMNPLQKTFYLNAYTSKLRRIIGPVDRPDRMFGAVACGGMDHSMQVDRLVKHVLYYPFKDVHETPLWVRITLPIFIIKQQLKVASKLAYTLGAKVDLIIGLALFHFPADTIVCLFFLDEQIKLTWALFTESRESVGLVSSPWPVSTPSRSAFGPAASLLVSLFKRKT